MTSQSEMGTLLARGNAASPPDGDGNGGPIPRDAAVEIGQRGRDVAALVALGAVLAALWVGVFSVSARSWGEYRPPVAELQAPPPPPTILVPDLTVEEAREILARAAGAQRDSHGER